VPGAPDDADRGAGEERPGELGGRDDPYAAASDDGSAAIRPFGAARKEFEKTGARAKNHFEDAYSIRATFPSPDDLCHLKGGYGGFEATVATDY
jgi:hypothetical protein